MSAFFIVDTNVLVAGLITSHADSPVARILDGMLSAAFGFVVSEALLAEYHDVLGRTKLRKLHGLSLDEIEVILTDIARHAIVLKPSRTTTAPPAPDINDQFLWNLMAERPDLVLVTGDKLLLADKDMAPRVLSPQEFVAQLKV